jgi:hypothetical protein
VRAPLLALLLALLAAGHLGAQDPGALVARGDSALAAGDTTAARIAYEAALAANPRESRALYQLATLRRAGSPEEIGLLRRYTEVQPGDAWGFSALGAAYLAAGDRDAARAAYGTALALAPDAGDIRARAAELDPLARRGRPGHVSIEPSSRVIRDSDGTGTWRLGLNVAVPVLRDVRLSAAGSRLSLRDAWGVEAAGWEGSAAAEWRQGESLGLFGSAGAVQVSGTGTPMTITPTLHVRARATSESGLLGDVRIRREPLAATPHLLLQPVIVAEATGLVQVPVTGPWHARAVGRLGRFDAPDHVNHRTSLGGGPVYRFRGGPELAMTWRRTTFADSTDAGYFAPARVDGVDLGIYHEHYRWRPLSIVVDAGLGVQRLADFAGSMGEWGPALRLWSQVIWPVAPGTALKLELEAYESQMSDIVAPANGAWRWGSATLYLAVRR